MGKSSDSSDDLSIGRSVLDYTDQIIIGLGESLEPPQASVRKYLPTSGELVDHLVIKLLKQINIAEHRGKYRDAAGEIMHDLNGYLGCKPLTPVVVHAIVVLALVNREIWLNESMARRGGSENDHLLKFTHSLNGVRNTAKNIINAHFGERLDLKVDSYAANLPAEFGNWNVFA